MAWAKNGTPHTLTSAGDTMTISNLTAKKFNQILFHQLQITSNVDPLLTFNNNTNPVYATRTSTNDGAEVTEISQPNIEAITAYISHQFIMSYLISITSQEKLGIYFRVSSGVAGVGIAPLRAEMVYKFVPSPDAGITRVDFNNIEGGNFDTGSNLSALGTD